MQKFPTKKRANAIRAEMLNWFLIALSWFLVMGGGAGFMAIHPVLVMFAPLLLGFLVIALLVPRFAEKDR